MKKSKDEDEVVGAASLHSNVGRVARQAFVEVRSRWSFDDHGADMGGAQREAPEDEAESHGGRSCWML